MIRNLITKKNKNKMFDKTQNHDLFISPKQKKIVLEMSLKSSIMSKLAQLRTGI